MTVLPNAGRCKRQLSTLLRGSGLGCSLIWLLARSRIRCSLWFLTLSFWGGKHNLLVIIWHGKKKVVCHNLSPIQVLFGSRKRAWNPNIALSQSSRSNSPVLWRLCSNELGQFKPRVFHSAETAALIYNHVNKAKEVSVVPNTKQTHMNHGRNDTPLQAA